MDISSSRLIAGCDRLVAHVYPLLLVVQPSVPGIFGPFCCDLGLTGVGPTSSIDGVGGGVEGGVLMAVVGAVVGLAGAAGIFVGWVPVRRLTRG